MEILEIVLLAAGAVIFLISYCIPVREEKLKEETKNLAAEEVKSLVEGELEMVRGRLSELSEEEIKDQIGQSERTMERISNEKIMAVNEYSDTVLEEIHKNHEEVVFLYDMLKSKKENLSETYGKADKDLQELLQQVKDSEITVREKLGEISEKQKELEMQKAELVAYVELEAQKAASAYRSRMAEELQQPKEEAPPARQEVLEENEFQRFMPEEMEAASKKVRVKKAVKKPEPKRPEPPKEPPAEDMDVRLLLSDTMKDNETGNNSNLKILSLHEAGKSNMAIARELGLGIGEVQLVIDLYEGMK